MTSYTLVYRNNTRQSIEDPPSTIRACFKSKKEEAMGQRCLSIGAHIRLHHGIKEYHSYRQGCNWVMHGEESIMDTSGMTIIFKVHNSANSYIVRYLPF